ncbi:MAG: hypothetical protein E6K54_03830 [Gammaproteobacteria bacterium]|nr:MAG: hypothetical protein E6K54_03830 [Gammaproteobacteria bacterium]
MMRINSVSNIPPYSTEKKSSNKLNTQSSSQILNKIKNSSAKKIVKRKNLANFSKKFNDDLYRSKEFKKYLNNNINARYKRGLDNNLVAATYKGDYNYWLSQEDIADIGRLKYQGFQTHVNYDSHFEIIGSFTQFKKIVKRFKERACNKAATIPGTRGTVLTLIIHQSENHWVSLVIFRDLGHITAIYLDSKSQALPKEYQIFLSKNTIELVNLTKHFTQQQDAHNCGLWALENAGDINLMLHNHEDILWAVNQIERKRDKLYFETLRKELAQTLVDDLYWRNRHPNFYAEYTSSDQSTSVSDRSSRTSPEEEPALKRPKFEPIFTLNDRLTVFSEAFIANFGQRLAACHVIAREGRISIEALQTELITGITGSLLGIAFSECGAGNCMGVVPSLAASARAISGKLLIKKKSAQRITKCFDGLEKARLSIILTKAAYNIFSSYEYQFIHINDKSGIQVAMEKLADDAVDRIMNFLKQQKPNGLIMSNELLEKGLLQGPSQSFFDPNLKLLQLSVKGKTLINDQLETIDNEISIISSKLFENVGVIAFDTEMQVKKFYISKKYPQKYGNRRLFDWEKEINSDLKLGLRAKYSEVTQNSDYQYTLTPEMAQTEAEQIKVSIENKVLPADMPVLNIKQENKQSILFNLREPIAYFTGREESIRNLHDILSKNFNMAVISPSLMPSSVIKTDNGGSVHSHTLTATPQQDIPLSISGLGGIGKTQLALQYAKLYRDEYDNNILWINAEAIESLDTSFFKLANKIGLETKNRYAQDKEINEIADMVYQYFSDKKSLFIFDNAEDFRSIETYLPKSLLGNKPTILITSRFSHWKNVASVLTLNVFTDYEALSLFNKILKNNIDAYQIFTLNKMLQGLPLALNQAIAYIQFQRETDPEFSIDQYIELFKRKAELLLNYNLEYNNDPYLKTVFTTWLVTLDKIKMIPELGSVAIELLDHMIFLDPENISPSNFFALKDLHNIDGDYIFESFKEYTDRIRKGMFLLKSYSLLNSGVDGSYTLHRLVQQVHRITIEKDPIKFEKMVLNTQALFRYQNEDQKNDSHYLHFLLYMIEHENSSALLGDNCIENLFNKLANKEIKYWFYFLDLAYRKFTRKRYLEFLADSLAYCRKEGFTSLVTEMLNYFEDQYELANFNLEDIVDMFSRIEYSKEYEIRRFSTKPEKKIQQKEAIHLIAELKKKIFGTYHNYNSCLSSQNSKKKRNVCSDEEMQEWIENKEYESSKAHVEKVGRISHYINSGLITKDILSELIRGEWEEVAVNVEFILGSQILGKVSNLMLIQGSRYEGEAHLLEKELGLENPKIWSLLLSEEVTFIGKKLLLGKVLQVGASFVGSATDLLAIYNLRQAIEAYENGDKTVVPEIVGTSVISVTGATGLGLSVSAVLGYIERSTLRLINPYLAAFSALVWLGTSLYKTEAQIQALQKYVHLSAKEHYVEFMRNFLNYPPSSYLQAKSNNGQLVLYALDFLKNNTDFRWYIAPIFSANNIYYENSTVLLDHERPIELSVVTPDEPSEGHLACLPGVPEDNKSASHFAYLCNGAFGLEYLIHRTAEVALINLGSGNDTIFAIPDFPNYFLVQKGKKIYRGGDEGNIFRLESNATTGKLTGGRKSDALILEQFHSEKNTYLFIDSDGFLCDRVGPLEDFTPEPCSKNNAIELNKINQVYGREKQQDVIYLDPAMQFIDGYGGYDTEHADIFFITERAFPNPSLVLRNNTLVLFPINNCIQSVDYQIPATEIGKAEIRTNFSATVKHRFFFNTLLENILSMRVQNDTLTVSVFVEDDTDVSTFTITLYDPSFLSEGQPHFKNVTNFEKRSSYFFENMEIKLVNNEQLFAQEILENGKTLDEKIVRFAELASHLEKTMTIQLLNNETLVIGGRSHDYFSLDGSSVSHLNGNGGENVYLIIPPKKNVLFPLADITLYASPSTQSDLNEQIDTLNLCVVSDYVKKKCPYAVISFELLLEGSDLILNLISYLQSGKCTDVNEIWELASIRLKDGIYWYKKLDILLEDKLTRRITTMDGEAWTLTGPVLIVKEYKNIINLLPSDITENSEIVLLRNSGNYSFFRNESDLILTNVHTETSSTPCTIIAHDYYQNPEMQRKLLSSKLSFLDEDDEDSFHLKDHQALIDEAQHFSDFAKLLASKDTFKHKQELSIPVLLKHSQELPKIRPKRQINGVTNDSSFQIALGIKIGIGLGGVVSALLTVRFLNKVRNSPLQNIPLQTIVMTGLASLKPADAQEQSASVAETRLDFFNGFSIENNCLMAETSMGWLAVCHNQHNLFYLKTYQSVSSFYFESYQANNTYFQYVDHKIWKNDHQLKANVLAEEIYPLLPKHWQEEFMELRTQDQAWSNWKYHAGMTVTSMVGDGLVLHTPVGNVFKQLGLAPDWQSREDRYFLSRCGLALEQPLFHRSLTPSSLSLGLMSMELALLHPASHRAYRYLSRQGDVAKAKFALRLVADMLQLGVNQISHLAHVLDYCFPTSDLAKNMSLALRISHYFYFLTGDLSCWYLGLSLFFLPKIPLLLDHIGIPASRVVQRVCQQLANVLLGQTLLQRLSEDEERQVQADRELSCADAQVTQARQRLSAVATAGSRFFMPIGQQIPVLPMMNVKKNEWHRRFLIK